MQISTNGFVSFEEELVNSHIIPSRRALATIVPVVAPLWADFNFRDAGIIYYKVSYDETTLRQVAERLRRLSDAYRDFTPRVAVVVTWFRAHLLKTNSMVRQGL